MIYAHIDEIASQRAIVMIAVSSYIYIVVNHDCNGPNMKFGGGLLMIMRCGLDIDYADTIRRHF